MRLTSLSCSCYCVRLYKYKWSDRCRLIHPARFTCVSSRLPCSLRSQDCGFEDKNKELKEMVSDIDDNGTIDGNDEI